MHVQSFQVHVGVLLSGNKIHVHVRITRRLLEVPNLCFFFVLKLHIWVWFNLIHMYTYEVWASLNEVSMDTNHTENSYFQIRCHLKPKVNSGEEKTVAQT